jgi:hypothetical protein
MQMPERSAASLMGTRLTSPRAAAILRRHRDSGAAGLVRFEESARRMSSRYNAADIEVLSGLEPVKRRPGMYTDTTRPNHLAQEVIDNSVDEALAGYARSVEVVVYADGSVEVTDDGRFRGRHDTERCASQRG